MKWVADDRVSKDLAELESGNLDLRVCLVLVLRLVDQTLAGLESSVQNLIPGLGDQVVLIGELSVFWVLSEWISQAISDCNTLEVQWHISCFCEEFVGNSWDIMPGVALASDEEVTVLVLWVLINEALEHDGHVLGDFLLALGVVEASLGEASADWLVDIEQVSECVPGVRVGLDGAVSGRCELIGTVLVEESDLRSAAWSSMYRGEGIKTRKVRLTFSLFPL